MGLIKTIGSYALVGVASVILYEGISHAVAPTQDYEVKTIEKRSYVIDKTANPPDTVAAPKLFEVYGFMKDTQSKAGQLESKYSPEQGWYESRR